MNAMRKILLLIDSGGMYGAERVVLTLLEELTNSKHEAILGCICDRDSDGPPIANVAVAKGIEVVRFPMKRGLAVDGIRAIKDYLISKRIQIVHAHGYKADLFLRLIRVPGLATVSTVHGWSKQDLAIKGKVYRYLDAIALRGMDSVIAVSRAVADDLLKRGVSAKGITVIYNGISLDACRSKGSRQQLRKNFDISEKDFVICCVGRLAKVKGHTYLVEAIERLLKDVPNCCLVIAGDGPLRSQLLQLIADRGLDRLVRLVGFTEDIPAFLGMSDVFALPSLSEGLPISLLEAMALRLPVVASSVGGIPEVICSPKYGILVPPADPIRLYLALKDLYHQPRRRDNLGNAGFDLVRDTFSARAMAAQYDALYSALL